MDVQIEEESLRFVIKVTQRNNMTAPRCITHHRYSDKKCPKISFDTGCVHEQRKTKFIITLKSGYGEQLHVYTI